MRASVPHVVMPRPLLVPSTRSLTHSLTRSLNCLLLSPRSSHKRRSAVASRSALRARGGCATAPTTRRSSCRPSTDHVSAVAGSKSHTAHTLSAMRLPCGHGARLCSSLSRAVEELVALAYPNGPPPSAPAAGPFHIFLSHKFFSAECKVNIRRFDK